MGIPGHGSNGETVNTEGTDHATDPDFEALAHSPVLAELAVLVRQLTGLRMALNTLEVTEIRLPRETGKGSPLCELVGATEQGYARCRACDRLHHGRAAARQKALLYTCHAGFLDLAVPIFVDGRHVATLSSGQVLPEPPSKESASRLYERVSGLPIPEKAYTGEGRCGDAAVRTGDEPCRP